jgi:hypothetical protein
MPPADIRDEIDRIYPPVFVGERLATLTQATDQRFKALHPGVESHLGRIANRLFGGRRRWYPLNSYMISMTHIMPPY